MTQVGRREFVGGLAALSAVPSVALAQRDPYPGWTEVGPNTYDIGLPSLEPVTVRQRCPQWCWAASIETIFGAWGYIVPQEQIVHEIYGGNTLSCFPATDDQMITAISRRYRAVDGRVFESRHFPIMTNAEYNSGEIWRRDNQQLWFPIITELTNNRPLLAAYRNSPTSGHAVVITQVRVRLEPERGGRHEVQGITIRDPWPESDRRRMLDIEQARQLGFIAAVTARGGN